MYSTTYPTSSYLAKNVKHLWVLSNLHWNVTANQISAYLSVAIGHLSVATDFLDWLASL